MTHGDEQSAYNPLAEKMKRFSQGENFYFSSDTATIITTEDRLFRILTKHLKVLEQKRAWIAPLGMGGTFLVAIITTNEYNDFLGLKKEIWAGVFIVSMVVCFLWFTLTAIGLRNHLKTIWKGDSIDDLLEKIIDDSEKWLSSSGAQGRRADGATLLAQQLMSAWLPSSRHADDSDDSDDSDD